MEYKESTIGPDAGRAPAARAVRDAILDALLVDEKTREPLNALVIWTELGRGLAGKLERQGADAGLLRRLIAAHCTERSGGAPVDLDAWAYRVEPARRLSADELGRALARVQRGIGERLAAMWADGDGGAHTREDFLAAVRGWFPAGLAIVRSLPAAAGHGDAEIHAALGAWCGRYLPDDTAGPEELGVRRERSRAEAGPC